MKPVYRYLYAGLVIQSTAPLSRLADAPGTARTDVLVEFGPLPVPSAECIRSKPHFQVYADGCSVLRSPEGACFLLDNGCRIRVDAGAHCGAAECEAWLMGPALALLLHQRGLAPLHASAVAIGDVAVAIAGDSGAGKSTTARALIARGGRLLCDDKVVVSPHAPVVHPGQPAMRLWAETAMRFDEATPDSARVSPGLDKFVISAGLPFQATPCPLAAVVMLSPGPATAVIAERASPGAAAASLHRFVYRVRLATFMGLGDAIFRWATTLAATVSVYHLRFPRDLDRLDEVAACIEGLLPQRVEA